MDFSLPLPEGKIVLERKSREFPYVPSDPATLDARCEEVYRIQVAGLATRMRATGTKKLVIGVSGGLDSTQALLVCARAMDELGLPRANILAYTMPGFATSTRTRSSAWQLMRAVGASAEEIDIRPSCMQMFRDLGHPYAKGRKVYDIAFENVQAGERTSHLFRLANHHGGLVVGTGDLSETGARLGDLWRWRPYVALQRQRQRAQDADPAPDRLGGEVRPVQRRGEQGARPRAGDGNIPGAETGESSNQKGPKTSSAPTSCRTSTSTTRCASATRPRRSPSSPGMRGRTRTASADPQRWLEVFLRRFFQTSQFKRSALPNGPKVGSGGSLSPRGDWRAPSDGNATAWLADLARVPESDPK